MDRKQFKYWDKFCQIQRFAFWRGGDDEKGAVIKVPDKSGLWIEQYSASVLVDEMQAVINILEAENEALKRRLSFKLVEAG